MEKTEGSITNLSIFPEFSLILVSTEATFYKIFSYRDFTNKKGLKYECKSQFDSAKINKRKNSFLSESIFEINPFSFKTLCQFCNTSRTFSLE